jgi:predicted DNA-binding protein
MATQMIVRIDPELKNKVSRIALSEGKNVSVIVRELLENYIKDRDIGSYIDDLWMRIGAKLKAQGTALNDIDSAIKDVRAKQ